MKTLNKILNKIKLIESDIPQSKWSLSLLELHNEFFNENGKAVDSYWEDTSCPSCQSEDKSFRFEKDNFKYWNCLACSLVYMNPRLNEKANQSFYNSNLNEIYNEDKFYNTVYGDSPDDRINKKNIDSILAFLYKNGILPNRNVKVLEIGSGKGFTMDTFKNLGFDVFGIELNKVNYEKIIKNHDSSKVFNKDLLDLNFDPNFFDIVYSRDLIEHIANPLNLMTEINRIMKKGGIIFTETHNIDGIIHRIVKEKHTVIFGFEHPIHWSVKSFKNLLNRTGFNIRSIEYDSSDVRLSRVIDYISASTFTTIFPWRKNKYIFLFLKIVNKILLMPGIKNLDETIFPFLFNRKELGSVMKVIAIKE